MTDLFARLLSKRKVGDDFLHPKYEINPDGLPDIEAAVKRICEAADKGEKVLIYGDYDVDGVTASTVMYDTLTLAGIKDVAVMLPDRFRDGYGMSMRAVERAKSEGRTLVVTVDCGANNTEVISTLKAEGIDTIVTDHHELMGEVPADAVAVVDAKRSDFDDKLGYGTLCGCGVAFVVAYALMKAGKIPEGQEKWLLDLALIGTVCDSMDLSSQINRIICYYGMKVLEKTRRVGLKELIRVSDLKDLNSFAIGFMIGPRLNAAGRLKSAEISLNLLMTKTSAQAAKLADELNSLNAQRKKYQTEAVEAITDNDVKNSVIVVSGKWHEGVVGIIAGRLVEKYHKPAFVLTETEDGNLKGSGRSFGDFNLAQALSECQDCLLTGGGHSGACGISLLKDNLETFRTMVNKYYNGLNLKNQEDCFAVVGDLNTNTVGDFTEEFIDELATLEPFGEGNPEPIFELDNMFVQSVRRMGSEGTHLRLTLRDADGKTMQVLAFSAPQAWFDVCEGDKVDALVKVEKSEWMGITSVEGQILELKIAG